MHIVCTLYIRYGVYDDHLGLNLNYVGNASPYLTPRGMNTKGGNYAYIRICVHVCITLYLSGCKNTWGVKKVQGQEEPAT